MSDFNKRQHARRLATCKHFNGIQNDECRAGVAMRSVRDESAKPYRWPCVPSLSGGECATTCAKREFPTAAEVDAEEARFRRAMADTLMARKAIVDKIGPYKKGHPGESGEMPCPVCGAGTLRYTRAALNGHVWGACTTDNCVRWME